MANFQRNNEVVPNPDPSAITTAQIEKEVASLEARIMARLDGMVKAVEVFHADLTRVPTSVDKAIIGLREILETRLHCMEDDVKAVHKFLDIRAKDVTDQIAHLHALAFERIAKLGDVTEERFLRIDTQFVERDKRTDQLSLADKTAVAAALQAAKEAVGAQNTSNSIAIAKSESSTVESIRQLQALFNTSNTALKDSLNEVKSRIDKGEGGTQAGNRSTDRTSTVVGQVIAGAVAFVVIMTAIVGVVAFMTTRSPAPAYLPPAVNSTAR